MDLDLKRKKALITGSSSGIGKAIAFSLVAEGAEVVINGRKKAKIQETIDEIKDKFPNAVLHQAEADLGTKEGCQKVIREYPNLDILINNLGIFEPLDYFEIPDQDWFKMFEINIMSGVRMARHYLRDMIEKNEGRVIFISSEAGIMPDPDMSHYSATKTMQLSLSRSLAEMTTGTNVTVNTVMPGPTLSEGVQEMLTKIYPDDSLKEAERRFIKEQRPTSIIQRLIKPEEIAHLVTFVSSPLASAVNGAALRSEGGLVRSIL